MNKILCDNCKEQIKPVIESKHLTGGIRIQFCRCNSCKDKILIDVTDQTTRDKQIELSKWSEQRKKALDVEIHGMETEKIMELALLTDECQFNMDKLKAEIKEAKAELKERYGDLL